MSGGRTDLNPPPLAAATGAQPRSLLTRSLRYFYVGAEIQLAGHPFILIDADEGTLRHMDMHQEKFEFSNIKHVLSVYSLTLLPVAQSGELLAEFQALDPNGLGVVSMRDFKGVLMKYECSYYFGGPPEQAVLSLCRRLGNKTSLNYNQFVAAIIDPSVLDQQY